MKVVLLAGGLGTRLWPVSTKKVPKQYVKFFNEETMLVSTYKKLKSQGFSIYVATNKKQSKFVKKQLGNNIRIIKEPEAHGTFGAMLNIANYFKYVEKINLDETIITIPIDHDVDQNFYDVLNEMAYHLNDEIDFGLIGIEPTYPTKEYGYIIEQKNIVQKFVEKPNEHKAINLINNGAYWNSGIVAFKLETMCNISNKYLNVNSYKTFYKNYKELPKNSFDREVLEKSKKIYVVKTKNKWMDLGTWQNLYSKVSNADIYNTNIINTENKKIINNGVTDSIIVNTSNGIALFEKNKHNIFYRHWGYYKIIDTYKTNGNNVKVKYLKICANKNISYQYHKFREEVWYVTSGSGIIVIDGKQQEIKIGDIIKIGKEQKHSVKSLFDLEIIEIQRGIKTVESDIVRLEKKWELIVGVK